MLIRGFIECLWNDSLPFFFLLKVGWHLEIASVVTIPITGNLEQETQRSVSGDLLHSAAQKNKEGERNEGVPAWETSTDHYWIH